MNIGVENGVVDVLGNLGLAEFALNFKSNGWDEALSELAESDE